MAAVEAAPGRPPPGGLVAVVAAVSGRPLSGALVAAISGRPLSGWPVAAVSGRQLSGALVGPLSGGLVVAAAK